MPRISRWMKPMPPARGTSGGRAFLVILGLATVFALSNSATRPAGLTLVGIIALEVIATLVARRRERRLRAQRAGEDIGSFAGAFDRRAETFDPLLVRAVWDALQALYGSAAPMPLRPSDRFADLWLDEEDLYDALPIIAERTGRSFAHLRYDADIRPLQTIAEYVALLSTQPRAAA